MRMHVVFEVFTWSWATMSLGMFTSDSWQTCRWPWCQSVSKSVQRWNVVCSWCTKLDDSSHWLQKSPWSKAISNWPALLQPKSICSWPATLAKWLMLVRLSSSTMVSEVLPLHEKLHFVSPKSIEKSFVIFFFFLRIVWIQSVCRFSFHFCIKFM